MRNGGRHLATALDSLLVQTLPVTIVALDDASTDGSPEILASYGDRMRHERSERRLGLVDAWRRVHELALEAAPDARYFAWASDHDVWEPRWAEALADALDAQPEAVLAHPLTEPIDEEGSHYKRRSQGFDTAGVRDPLERVRRTNRSTRPGDLVYGLYRVDALRRCGPFPRTLLPDRLLLGRLAVEGEVVHVPEPLWRRRYRRGVKPSLSRQRASLFGDRVPLAAYGPFWASHARWFLASLPHRPDRLRLTLAYTTSAIGAVSRQRSTHRRRMRRRSWKRARRRAARLRRGPPL